MQSSQNPEVIKKSLVSLLLSRPYAYIFRYLELVLKMEQSIDCCHGVLIFLLL